MSQPNRQPPSLQPLLGGCIVSGLLLVGLILLPDRLPLGVPGEWVWPRLAAPEDIPELIERGLPALLVGLLMLGIAALGDRSPSRLRRGKRLLFAVLLAGGSVAWQLAALSTAPSPHRELRLLWVNYDPYATGYFSDARADERSIGEFLAAYEADTAAGDVLHRGTHPPGLPVLNRLLLRLTQGAPGLSRALNGLAEGSATEYFRSLERQAALAPPLTDSELAALVLLAAAALGCCAALPILVLLLLEPFTGYRTAWRVALLTTGLPAVSVFLPRSDMQYAASGCLLLLLTGRGIFAATAGRRLSYACLTGLWTFACLQVSLAHLPVVLGMGLWTTFDSLQRPRTGWRDVFVFWVVMITALLLAAAAFGLFTGCRPWVVWRQNLLNHEAFYDQYPRTLWKWLLVNPLELTFAAGPPLALAGAAGLLQSLRGRLSGFAIPPENSLGVALFSVWLLLLLSGKNQGEAARLWTFITPWVAIAAAPLLAVGGGVTGGGAPRQAGGARAVWLLLLAAQLATCAVTTARVTGYLEL